jgi:radical SAM family uncharacterized protein
MEHDILLQVRKPARYIGSEVNSSHKSNAGKIISFALCFPGLYEIGMSNLGLRIIYGLLNNRKGCSCERFFLPDTDMLSLIKEKEADLVSLESRRLLGEFDIIGFSLQHELDYTNVLAMLELGRIPFYSRQRRSDFPLLIAGGPALANPEPIADFFDCIIIGEAEEVLLEFIAEFKRLKSKVSKFELLESLACLEGVYVPSLYKPIYDNQGSFKTLQVQSEEAPALIKRRLVKDLDASFFPADWVVPYISISHDRILMELMRGCPHHCYFCQARNIYAPFRIRSKDTVLALASHAQKESGYEEIALLGLSASDHPQIAEIVSSLLERFQKQRVSISLGSLRPSEKIAPLLANIAAIRKTGLTLAIESASQRLRKIINKSVDIQALKELIAASYSQGYRRVKLYFMFGLPFETKADLEAIADLVFELAHIGGVFRKNIFFTVSINAFIPKPHTVFQWLAMDDLAGLQEKKRFLILSIRRKIRNIKIDFRPFETAMLEALFSRGDRRLAALIVQAYRKGALFDGYTDRFNLSAWQEALKLCNINISDYIHRQISCGESLAWDHIALGLSKEHLQQEYEGVKGELHHLSHSSPGS